MANRWEDADRYWRTVYTSRPYASGLSYEVLWPGYRFGHEAAGRFTAADWSEIEHELARAWEECDYRAGSTWEQVKDAVRDAWTRAVETGRSAMGLAGAGGSRSTGRAGRYAGEWAGNGHDGMSTGVSMLTGLAVGAALVFILDPDVGRRRRALARDKMIRATRKTREALDATSRDLANRARGVAAEARHIVGSDAADDHKLRGRVRAELGRAVSHPRAIEVEVDGGRVTLRGPILAGEVAGLVSAVGAVRGVAEVNNQLEPHETAEHVPSLQGGRMRPGPRIDVLQANWSPATRVLVGAAGSALAAWGFSRRDTPGMLLGAAGTLLAAQAATNASSRLARKIEPLGRVLSNVSGAGPSVRGTRL